MIHIRSFLDELAALRTKGLNTDGRIFVSEAAHVVFDLHQRVDGLEELALGKAKVGTTGKGIGPCYSTKAARSGVRIVDMVYNKAITDTKLRHLAVGYKKRYGDLLDYDVEEEIKRCDEYREQLRPMVVDAISVVTEAQKNGEQILVEGANALMLDVWIFQTVKALVAHGLQIDSGTYPYVTSSNTSIGGCITGLPGLKRRYITNIIGVVKA